MTIAERLLAAVAALITVVNFLVFLPPVGVEFHGAQELPIGMIQELTVPGRVVVTLILEVSLALFFGRLFLVIGKGESAFSLLGWTIIGLCSAWISLLNMELLLIGTPVAGLWGYLGLFFLMVGVGAIAIFFIYQHYWESSESQDNATWAGVIQGLAFLVIFIAACSS